MSAQDVPAADYDVIACRAGTLTLNQLTINNEAIYTLLGHSLDEVSLLQYTVCPPLKRRSAPVHSGTDHMGELQVLRLSALSADTHSEEAIDMVMRSCCPDKVRTLFLLTAGASSAGSAF